MNKGHNMTKKKQDTKKKAAAVTYKIKQVKLIPQPKIKKNTLDKDFNKTFSFLGKKDFQILESNLSLLVKGFDGNYQSISIARDLSRYKKYCSLFYYLLTIADDLAIGLGCNKKKIPSNKKEYIAETLITFLIKNGTLKNILLPNAKIV